MNNNTMAEELSVFNEFIHDNEDVRQAFKKHLELIVDIGEFDKDFDSSVEERMLEDLEDFEHAISLNERPYIDISIDELKKMINKEKEDLKNATDKLYRKITREELNILNHELIERAIIANGMDYDNQVKGENK